MNGEFESPPRTSYSYSLLASKGKTIGRKVRNITNKEWVGLNEGKRW